MFGADFTREHDWTNAIPLFAAGIVLLVFGILVNRVLVSKDQLRQNPDSKYNHTLYAFPIEYWSIPAFAMAFVAFVKGCSSN